MMGVSSKGRPLLFSSVIIFAKWALWVILVMDFPTTGTLNLAKKFILCMIEFQLSTFFAVIDVNLYYP